MALPETHYAKRRDGVSIAYQVLGDGPLDLVLIPGFVSHLDFMWTDPAYAACMRRFASFSRLIIFDKLGTGCSDPIAYLPALEERAEDIALVMDAAGSRSAAVMGNSEGGPAAALLAATQPDRVSALVLFGTLMASPSRLSDEELAEYGYTRAEVEALQTPIFDVLDHWGEGLLAPLAAPSLDSKVLRRFYGLFERACASPGMARALVEGVLRTFDVREALAAIGQPTLVLHRTGDAMIPVLAGREMAKLIPGALFKELGGDDHAFWFGDYDPVIDEIEQFLTGERRHVEPERALATVLFTDIVGSTERAAQLGDQAWRRLLERHDEVSAAEVQASGGRMVKHTGDGLLASFDGPARAVRCAARLVELEREQGIDIRAGVHTGECELRGEDIGGLAVHIGARVAAKAGAGEVLVSSTVRDLVVGSELRFSERGQHELKGVPGSWTIFALGEDAPRPAPLPPQGEFLRRGDRTTLRAIRRAPGAFRLGTRLARRNA
jgi:class 3 adenylate cyclase